MTIKKVTNFVFPIGNEEQSQDAYYRALSEASSGFYPFGENGLWHGGIHIDADVLRKVGNSDEIRCMANGEVIAYRVNDVYPKISYGDAPFPYKREHEYAAYFSTGFTVVRHRLVMPKIAGESEAPPSITLYSLYMHQLDWYGYSEKFRISEGPTKTPSYWKVISGSVSNKTKDRVKGTIIRQNGRGTEGVGLLLKGSKVKLGAQIDRTQWYQLASIVEGGFFSEDGTFYQDLVYINGYVYGPEISDTISDDAETIYTLEKENNNKLGSPEKTVAGITIYQQANDNAILAYLPKGTDFRLDGEENGYGKIVEIVGNYVPPSLVITNDAGETSHQGWVKLSNLTQLSYEPKELDKVVVLDKPVPITGGDFIGYLGHNVSRQQKFIQSKQFSLGSQRRADTEKLAKLGHFELFTPDDLPAFITKTRALAEKLPENEKTLVAVERGAQLIQERPADGQILNRRWVSMISSIHYSYYVQATVYYVLMLRRYQLSSGDNTNMLSLGTQQFDSISMSDSTCYNLSASDKADLVSRYKIDYPELTEANIPDTVELMSNRSNSFFDDSNLLSRLQSSYLDEVEIRFSLVNSETNWIKSADISYLQDGEGQLNGNIAYWKTFPLSLTDLPEASTANTVHYPRTIPISSLEAEYNLATDADYTQWAYVTAANKECSPIKGWVNISKGEQDCLQENIKRVSPWSWLGFEKIQELASVGGLLSKTTENKKMVLELEDYTESMKALHHILTETPLNETLQTVLPPFTDRQLKEGLKTQWTAEQIGRLAVKYESEWYADESLSKWNEIDVFYEEQKEQKRTTLVDKLTAANITKPVEREYALSCLEENYQQHISEWQIEKEQRIKPSLWWSDVVTAQQAQTDSTTEPVLSTLPADGKVWYLHPVGMRALLVQPYINDEGYIEVADIIFDKIPAIERDGLNKFNAIILHRTAEGELKKVLRGYKNSGVVGTHFVIDKNGDIYQCASLFKYTNHIGKIRMRAIYEMRATQEEWKLYYGYSGTANNTIEQAKSYPERFPVNKDSIGIEVVASYTNNQWETATQEQLSSVARLIPILQNLFQLTDEDIYQHQHISSKQPFEGWGLYPPSDVGVNAYPIIDKSGIKMTEENKYYLARYKKEKGY